MINFKKYLLFNILLTVLFIQCKIDYENIVVLDSIPTGLATMEVQNSRYTEVNNFKIVNFLQVSRLDIFQQPETIRIIKGNFLSFSNGEILDLSGLVGAATFDRASKDADIDGNVFVRSERDNISIAAQNLRWFNDRRLLESEPDAEITVRRDDGSWFTGIGLSIDMTDKTVHYKSKVRGQFVVDES